jgi:hypothetical protein
VWGLTDSAHALLLAPHSTPKFGVQVKAAGMVAGMGDADMLHAAMHRTGDYGLLRFLPAATLAVASPAAGPERCLPTCLSNFRTYELLWLSYRTCAARAAIRATVCLP